MIDRTRLVCVLLFACLPSAAFAQRTTTGTIIGKVLDASGGVLPGATISLKSPEALGQFTAVTDGGGEYRVTNLPPTTYEIRAELPRTDSGKLLKRVLRDEYWRDRDTAV